jgi:hypothetical protein
MVFAGNLAAVGGAQKSRMCSAHGSKGKNLMSKKEYRRHRHWETVVWERLQDPAQAERFSLDRVPPL